MTKKAVKKKTIAVNDRMQRGYRYVLSAPAGRNFDPDFADVHFKPESSLTLKNAVATPTAIEFLDFARFPLASVQPEGDGFRVRLRDMRFASELSGRRGVVAVINLNAQSLVISEHLEFDSH